MQNVPQDLFNLLISKDFEVKTLDAKGKEISDVNSADMFSFNFETNGKDYGTVVILINSNGDLEIFYGDNVGQSMESADKKDWMNFLYQLRMFAKRNLLGFKLQDISKLKYSMQGMAAINEGLFEGYYGSKKTSYSPQGNARIIIKHTRPIGENEKRYYNIESIYVENADGERFKLPFKSLMGARAMARHVTEGGNPYDIFGSHITEMVKDIHTLSGFVRRSGVMEADEETANVIEAGKHHYVSLRKKLKNITGRRGYHTYLENWSPADITVEETEVNRIRELFTQKSINSKIDEALPLLARIATAAASSSNDDDLLGTNKMKEISEFESWADDVTEGSWSLPNTDEKIEQLRDFMSKKQPYGIDAINVTDQLYDVIGDDTLFDALQDDAKEYPDGDARPTVMNWVRRNMPDLVSRISPRQTQESCENELDADNDQHLYASANKIMDKRLEENYNETYGLENLSVELRNAISDDLVSVYDLLAETIGFQPSEKEMSILQNAFNEIQIDKGMHPDDDFDEICNAITEVIQSLQDTNESEDVLSVVESDLHALLQKTNYLLSR
jgi:hypothetical protein